MGEYYQGQSGPNYSNEKNNNKQTNKQTKKNAGPQLGLLCGGGGGWWGGGGGGVVAIHRNYNGKVRGFENFLVVMIMDVY